MQKGVFYIFSGLRGIFPAGIAVLLSVMMAAAQKPVQHLVVDHCEAYIFSVQDLGSDRYTWHLYKDLDWDEVNFAQDAPNVDPTPYFDDGNYQTDANHPSVKVSGLEPGDYFLKVEAWDEVACTNNLMVFRITVEDNPLTATFEDPGDQCYGDPILFKIILTGRGPYEVIYSYGDGTASVNLVGETDEIYFGPEEMFEPGEVEFWIMEVKDACSVVSYPVPGERPSMKVIINPLPKSSDIYVKPEP